MRRIVIGLTIVAAAVSVSNAAIYIKGGPVVGVPGETATLFVGNDAQANAYETWLEIVDPKVARFAGCPAYLPGIYVPPPCQFWPEYGEWIDVTVVNQDLHSPIPAGDHIRVDIELIAEGETAFNVYADDGATLLATTSITVIPEPATVALLGAGVLLGRRRRLRSRACRTGGAKR